MSLNEGAENVQQRGLATRLGQSSADAQCFNETLVGSTRLSTSENLCPITSSHAHHNTKLPSFCMTEHIIGHGYDQAGRPPWDPYIVWLFVPTVARLTRRTRQAVRGSLVLAIIDTRGTPSKGQNAPYLTFLFPYRIVMLVETKNHHD